MATFGTSPLGPKTGSFQWEMASTLPRCFVLATVGSNQTRHHSVLTLHCGDAPQWRGAGPRKRTGYKPSVGRGLRCPPFSGFDPTYIPFFSSATCPFLFGRRFLFLSPTGFFPTCSGCAKSNGLFFPWLPLRPLRQPTFAECVGLGPKVKYG